MAGNLTRALRPVLLWAALAALAWSVGAAASGGIDARVLGFTIRARGAIRPLTIGLLLLALYVGLDWRACRAALGEPVQILNRLAPWLAVTLAAVTTIHAIRYGAFVASGSDSYGYLSEAYGWVRGPLPKPDPIPLRLPTPSSDWIQTPLGYWPGHAPHTIAPSYAPGLPWLLAAGILVADPLGPYLVVPLSAGFFVWVTFLLARRIAGPMAGLAAALIAGSSPIVLFMSLWVMSDVPAGVMWTASAWAALARPRYGALAAGTFAGLGLLIRPNLAPLALVPFASMVLAGEPADRMRRAVLFCVPVALAAIAIGALNAAWFGSPLLSGYGDASLRFALHYVWPNVRHYPLWLVESQSLWIAAAAVLSLGAFRLATPNRQALALAWAFVLVTFLCYVAYAPYEPWWYLRFLVPGLGAFYAVAAAGLSIVASRIPRPWGPLAACVILLLTLQHSVRYTTAQEMFGPFRQSEHRYADLGAFVARAPAQRRDLRHAARRQHPVLRRPAHASLRSSGQAVGSSRRRRSRGDGASPVPRDRRRGSRGRQDRLRASSGWAVALAAHRADAQARWPFDL